MSDQANAQNEPTMEEILASIRRIISEDGDENQPGQQQEMAAQPEAAPEPQAAEPEPVAYEQEEDVLELTEIIEEAPMEEAQPAEVGYDPEPEPAPQPEPEPDEVVMVDQEPAMPPAEQDDALVSADKAAAAAAAFQNLSRRVRVAETESQTLEALVRDLMRPMIKDWLDHNLPPIVERMVEREVKRIAGDH
jgi:cell pole-organizing protein PopZ